MDYILFVTINSGRGCSFVTIYSSVSYMSIINSHYENKSLELVLTKPINYENHQIKYALIIS